MPRRPASEEEAPSIPLDVMKNAIGPGESEPPPATESVAAPPPPTALAPVAPSALTTGGDETDPYERRRKALVDVKIPEIEGLTYREFCVRSWEAFVQALGLQAFSEGNKTHFLGKTPVAYRRLAEVIRRGPKGDGAAFPTNEEWRDGAFGK